MILIHQDHRELILFPPVCQSRPYKGLLRSYASPETSGDVHAIVRSLVMDNEMGLAQPGHGNSWSRFSALMEFGAYNLSVAKLLESHFDAITIMDEAHFTPEAGIYAVWASKFGGKHLTGIRNGDRWQIRGDIAFASGIDAIDFAIVPVETDSGEYLFQIPRATITSIDKSQWNASGMELSDTAWVTVEALLHDSNRMGSADFYLNRRGFWPGGIGVAACWLGGATGIFENWVKTSSAKAYKEPHDQAQRGRAYSSLKACTIYLRYLATRIEDPKTSIAELRREALSFRHLVDQTCSDLVTQSLRAIGPILMVSDAEHLQRCMDLQIFTRQCHAEKDWATLSKEIDNLDFKGDWFE
ncbi:MAG: hypothetical protein H7318_00225 [Oligoflexus sp.]|nr:hypothetical protein [Oligoflexus sp.]